MSKRSSDPGGSGQLHRAAGQDSGAPAPEPPVGRGARTLRLLGLTATDPTHVQVANGLSMAVCLVVFLALGGHHLWVRLLAVVAAALVSAVLAHLGVA